MSTAEWAVQYDIHGEPFVYRAESEKVARHYASLLGRDLLGRTVYETCVYQMFGTWAP